MRAALLEAGGLAEGFGVAAGLPHEIAAPLAGRCQELAAACSMWSTTTRRRRASRPWPSFAAGADRIELGVAVIALDRHGPEEIAADVERLGLDPSRLWIGVGAGFAKKPLTAMREALPACATPCLAPASSWPRWARRCAARWILLRRRLLQLDDA